MADIKFSQFTDGNTIEVGDIVVGLRGGVNTKFTYGESGLFTWTTVSGIAETAEVNTGYIIGNAAQTTITLPAIAGVGASVAIQGKGVGGWVLKANTGQTIQVGSLATSTAGTATSADQWDAVEVICVTADTTWATRFVLSSGLTIV